MKALTMTFAIFMTIVCTFQLSTAEGDMAEVIAFFLNAGVTLTLWLNYNYIAKNEIKAGK